MFKTTLSKSKCLLNQLDNEKHKYTAAVENNIQAADGGNLTMSILAILKYRNIEIITKAKKFNALLGLVEYLLKYIPRRYSGVY
jgi:hypothetical protein